MQRIKADRIAIQQFARKQFVGARRKIRETKLAVRGRLSASSLHPVCATILHVPAKNLQCDGVGRFCRGKYDSADDQGLGCKRERYLLENILYGDYSPGYWDR